MSMLVRDLQNLRLWDFHMLRLRLIMLRLRLRLMWEIHVGIALDEY